MNNLVHIYILFILVRSSMSQLIICQVRIRKDNDSKYITIPKDSEIKKDDYVSIKKVEVDDG